MALKMRHFQSSLTRYYAYAYYSSLSLPFINPRSFSSIASSSQSSHLDKHVNKLFHMINNCPSSQTMIESLKSFERDETPFSNALVDNVLKRVRFSHSNPLKALDFYNYFGKRRDFYHTQDSLDTLLYILGRSRRFDEIWELLIDVKRKDKSLISPRTLQVVLGRIAKVCSVRQTVEGFKRFRRLVYDFDTNCFNALLRVLCQEKTMVDARNVYHSLKGGFRPNLQTFNILLSGWKSSEEAEEFIKEMKDVGVRPDVVSYNSLIDVCCKSCKIEKAFQLIDIMREDDICPDVITYTSLIGGLGLAGQPDKARDLLNEMKEYGCYPDVAAYNAAIRNYCMAKRLGDAYELMNEMVAKGLNPNPTTYNLFFRVLYWSNDLKNSWSLYQRMKAVACLPNTQSCMFLIRLCRRHERVEMALELWNDMVEEGFGSYILVSVVLFDLLCDLGRLNEAETCFLQMVDKGQKPSSVSFRRIKVLMELANRHEALQHLSAKMAIFGPVLQVRSPNDDFDDATPLHSVAR